MKRCSAVPCSAYWVDASRAVSLPPPVVACSIALPEEPGQDCDREMDSRVMVDTEKNTLYNAYPPTIMDSCCAKVFK